MIVSRKKWRKLCRNESGSFLIEASMTMPLLLLVTLFLLGLGYAAYHRAMTVQQTYEWTERAAYVWKDSHKDPVTGSFSYEEMDDVYGTLLQEGFGWLTASFNGFRQAEIRMPERVASGSELPRAKLLRSYGSTDSGGLEGRASYYNRILEGEIRTEWTGTAAKAAAFLMVPVGGAKAEASSFVTDPVEFLRTVYLVKDYSRKLKERFQSPRLAAEQLSGIVPAAPERTVIRSEAQAKAYVKQLVGGSSQEADTRFGKRQIDVLDSDQIMHDAKYYINKSDALDQIKKDAELLRTGKVQGVVWHIFMLEKEKKYDLTVSLRQKLEENGIMVVFHR